MKKFDYRTTMSFYEDIEDICNRLGSLGWRLVTTTFHVDSGSYLLIFELEINN